MVDAVLLSACRTAIGTARRGSLRDTDAFELAAVVVREAARRGHPIATTGTRMVVTLAHELRRRGGGTAVAAMCSGGGMGAALVLTV
ncbi:hypothetical protein ACGF3G_34745 [Streptomyces sp. NPDC048179]|uniref:hypothetical protein n=1 Tax=Streptomyces sp. NPDC048179 TaxID=3365506 RepID=UPI0037166340